MSFGSEERLVAGPAVRSGATVVVPVLRMRARVLGAKDRALAGSAESELMGAWVGGARPAPGPGWLPAQPEPPFPADSWSDWLLAQHGLLDQIRTALESAG